MSSHKVSFRRSWQADAPAIEAVKLFQSSGDGEGGLAPPAASDVGRAPRREALLQACASGDQAALHSLYRETAPQLFGLALRILKSRETAAQILQDSFVFIWRNAHAFDPARGAAMAWLACIVRNRCIDLLRQRGRQTRLDEASIEDWKDPASSQADLAVLSRDARRLQDCVEELEEGPRKVLRLVYYEGMTYEEVAIHVGVPLDTVKSWVRHSLLRIKDFMQ